MRTGMRSARGWFSRLGRAWRGLMLTGAALAALPGCSQPAGGSGYDGPAFTVCSSTYARCTAALCEAIPAAPGFASCNCDVLTGYSAGLSQCQDVQETGQGQAIVSRYSPIDTKGSCSNDRPWANCLDSPCLIDRNDPSHAACICTLMQDKGAYLDVSASGGQGSSCTSGLYSSATVIDVGQVTDYLKTHDTPLKAQAVALFEP